MFWLKTPSDHL